MKLIKNYQCDSSSPSDAEIKEGMDVAANEHCIVRLHWFFPYSGNYHLDIVEGMSFDDCKEKLPKCYPI